MPPTGRREPWARLGEPDPLEGLIVGLAAQVERLAEAEEKRGGNGSGGNGNGRSAQKLVDSVNRILLLIVIPAVLAVGTIIWNHESRLSTHEAVDTATDVMQDHLRREHDND